MQELAVAAFETGLPQSKPAGSTQASVRSTHLARCRMTVALALPIFEHADRTKAVGALEIARMIAQPAPSFAFLSSLAACLKVRSNCRASVHIRLQLIGIF